MKVTAVFCLVTAVVARAVQPQPQPDFRIPTFSVGDIYSIFTCGIPCVQSVAMNVPPRGPSLAAAACSSIEEIKGKSEHCVQKCGISQMLIDVVVDTAHHYCDNPPKPQQ